MVKDHITMSLILLKKSATASFQQSSFRIGMFFGKIKGRGKSADEILELLEFAL